MPKKSLKQIIGESRKPWLILICGMPNSGKSSTAIKLASKLDFPVCAGTDEVREVMKLYDRSPFLQGVSHNRWRLYKMKTEEYFIAGFNHHSWEVKRGVMKIINKTRRNKENLIIEGVHLSPKLYAKVKGFRVYYILLKLKSEKEFLRNIKSKIIRRHRQQDDPWSKKIKDLFFLQNYLIDEASSVLKNNYIIFDSRKPRQNAEIITNKLYEFNRS